METAELVDELGFDHLWTVDHHLAPYGAPDQAILDGGSVLSGWATRTQRVRLGLFVGANTFRHPAFAAKLATTLDHMSAGRAILGLGAGWFEREHQAYGIEFGASPGERIRWLDEAADIARRLLDGETLTETEGRYRTDALRILPRPIQEHLPIVIGGGGEKKTLRVVARHADMWNAFGSPDAIERKIGILGEHCDAVGRDIADIELTLGASIIIRPTFEEANAVRNTQMLANRATPENTTVDPDVVWLGSVDEIVERVRRYRRIGITSLIAEMAAPFDIETIRALATEVRPRVQG
jgi:alkanesulfonate monooxygenase SsuD/methylene tetrahydromethanopterin reductase-like flavin-dependent oxidoreductase (luciferase family)